MPSEARRPEDRRAREQLSNASFHCRGDAKRFVNADKVVIHHVKRDGMGVIFDLLLKGISQAGEAAHVHPHG